MPDNRLQWPILDPDADDRPRVLVRGVFERNSEWTTGANSHYKSLFTALCGKAGARALAQGTKQVESVLANNGAFELLAVSLNGEDELIVTDGRDAILVSKAAHNLPVDVPPPGGRVRQLWKTEDVPRRSLQELCRKA